MVIRVANNTAEPVLLPVIGLVLAPFEIYETKRPSTVFNRLLTGPRGEVFQALESTGKISVTFTEEPGDSYVPLSSGGPVVPIPQFAYRHTVLGDESTGLYYVTASVRGDSDTPLDSVVVTKNIALSTPGTLGTFAVDVTGTLGVFLHSLTVTTYTRSQTQAKLVLAFDNPQGPVKAHEFVRPSAVLLVGNGAQSATPIVMVADVTGAAPEVNGMPYQVDPETAYPRIRVSVSGLSQATANVVTDPMYNRVQSLVVQF